MYFSLIIIIKWEDFDLYFSYAIQQSDFIFFCHRGKAFLSISIFTLTWCKQFFSLLLLICVQIAQKKKSVIYLSNAIIYFRSQFYFNFIIRPCRTTKGTWRIEKKKANKLTKIDISHYWLIFKSKRLNCIIIWHSFTFLNIENYLLLKIIAKLHTILQAHFSFNLEINTFVNNILGSVLLMQSI